MKIELVAMGKGDWDVGIPDYHQEFTFETKFDENESELQSVIQEFKQFILDNFMVEWGHPRVLTREEYEKECDLDRQHGGDFPIEKKMLFDFKNMPEVPDWNLLDVVDKKIDERNAKILRKINGAGGRA